MPHFKWTDWNRAKIAAHALSVAEVEAAFDAVTAVDVRADGSVEMKAVAPSGRQITVIWRYDDREELFDFRGDALPPPVFVITAF